MASQITSVYDTAAAIGNREDLADIISLISPEEVPFFSLAKDDKATAVKHEWQTDVLDTPVTTNKHLQGEVYAYSTATPTTRVGNYSQIFMKQEVVAETQEAVDHAGRASERAYQKMKMGLALKTDIEASFLSNNASIAGGGATAAQAGGLRAWIVTNAKAGSGGSSAGYNTGTGVVDAATNGTQRAFTKSILDDTLQAAYTSGGNPTVLMVSPYVKRIFSTFMSDTNVAQFRKEVANKASTIVGAADAYLSDWGLIDVVPNRQMARVGATLARNAFAIDTSKVRKSWLRKIQEDKDVAKTGDGLPIVLKGELTLSVLNEAAHGVAADLFGMTSST